jgi:hypothetical protein
MEVQSAGLDANRFMFDATLRRAYRATVAKTMTEQMQAKASGNLSANVVRENDVQITSAVDVTGSRRARSLAGGNAQHVDVGYSVRFSSAFAKDLPSQEEAAGYVDTMKDDPTEFLDTYNGVVEEKGLGPVLKMESAAVTRSATTATTASEASSVISLGEYQTLIDDKIACDMNLTQLRGVLNSRPEITKQTWKDLQDKEFSERTAKEELLLAKNTCDKSLALKDSELNNMTNDRDTKATSLLKAEANLRKAAEERDSRPNVSNQDYTNLVNEKSTKDAEADASDTAADASASVPPTDDTGGLPFWAWISIGVAGGLVVGLLLGGFVASRVVSNQSNKKGTAENGDGGVAKSRMSFGIPDNNDKPVGAMMENPLTQRGGAGGPALQPFPERMAGHSAQKTTEKKTLKRKTKRVSHSRGESIIPADAEVVLDEKSGRRYSMDRVTNNSEWIDEEDYEVMPGCTIHLDEASMRRYSYNATTSKTEWIDQ